MRCRDVVPVGLAVRAYGWVDIVLSGFGALCGDKQLRRWVGRALQPAFLLCVPLWRPYAELMRTPR